MGTALAAINAFIFFSLAALHPYWAICRIVGMYATIPTDGIGRKLFRPGRGITLIVAFGLFILGLCNMAFAGWLETTLNPG